MRPRRSGARDEDAGSPDPAASEPSRRVLIVTYFFPPVGGVGVQRTLKHVTYLPRWGWRPIVIAPRDPAYAIRDPTLLGVVPEGTETYRTLSLEPSRIVMLAARLLRRRTSGGRRSRPGPARSVVTRAEPLRRRPGYLRQASRRAARAWTRTWGAILFPDEAIAWLPSAVVTARRIVRTRHVDAIYSSSPPVSTHLIAALLRWTTGRPWVADFRDPWVDNAFAEPTSPLRRRMQLRAERWIVERADRVVVAVDTLRDRFVERYPDLAHKFVYIPNGYDRGDLGHLPSPPPREPGTFVLLYAGSIYRAHELDIFLAGIESLLARRPELRARLRVDFVGRINESNARVAAEAVAPGHLDGVVRFVGFVPRPQALARMVEADALVQLMAAEPGADMFVGGKLLEYLAFDRPILAMMPPGEGRRVVEGLPNGRIADVDPESVAEALEQLLDEPPPATPSDPDGRYDRVNLAGELARVLDEAIKAR